MGKRYTVRQISNALCYLGHNGNAWSVRECVDRFNLYELNSSLIPESSIPVIRADLGISTCDESFLEALDRQL